MKPLGAVLAATTLAAAPPDSASPLGPYSRLLVFGECLNEIATGVDELMDGGLSGFLVFGLPNLGRLPDVVGTPAAAHVIQAALAFNATLQQLSARCNAANADSYVTSTIGIRPRQCIRCTPRPSGHGLCQYRSRRRCRSPRPAWCCSWGFGSAGTDCPTSLNRDCASQNVWTAGAWKS